MFQKPLVNRDQAVTVAVADAASAGQNSVFFPVLETVCKTASGCTLPFTVTFCCSRSMSKVSTPEKQIN